MISTPENTTRRRIDWDAVRRRLDRSERALVEADAPAGDREAEILRGRADVLARRGLNQRVAARLEPMLVFTLQSERYALPARALIEVARLEQCTAVPAAPPGLLGVISRRGELRALIDLAVLLGLPTDGDRTSGAVLLLRRVDLQAGLRVDAVEEIARIDPAAVLAAESRPSEEAARCSTGVTRTGLILLDVEKLLAHELFNPAAGPVAGSRPEL